MIDAVLVSVAAGFPVMAAHFISTLAIFFLACLIYARITPHREMELIRENNIAAAVSFGGAILALAIPIASCMANSVSVIDIVVWGAVILTLQIVIFFAFDRIFKGLQQSIHDDKLAPAILLSAIKISVALISAAAVSA